MKWNPYIFEIRHLTSCMCENLEKLDKIICDSLGLQSSPYDYGHFLLFEGETSQTSISWVKLIHEILYYSDMDYGMKMKSEVFDAFFAKHTLKSSPRVTCMLPRLLDLLYDELNMYIIKVFPGDNPQILKNIHTREVILKNETGAFLCNEDGKLLSYYPSIEVLMDKPTEIENYPNCFYKPCIRAMKIPEGVTSFSSNFFRFGMIEEELILPNSLKTIGTDMDGCIFANTYIGHIAIPKSVEAIGVFAFGSSRIKELVYPDKIIESQYMRQFKDAIIDNLTIPKGVYCYLQRKRIKIEQLFVGWVKIKNYVVN